jgi:hypothetical protein
MADKKKPGIMIAVGVGKPKGDGMPPPGMHDEEPPKPPAEEGGGGQKHSREDALVVNEDQRCANCQNYDATSGECSEVEGYFDPGASCLRYFEPAGAADDEPETPGESEAAEPAEAVGAR